MMTVLLILVITILVFCLNMKKKIIYQTGGFGPKGVEILVPLKYLNNFWRTLEIPLVSCEIKSHSNLVYALFHTI